MNRSGRKHRRLIIALMLILITGTRYLNVSGMLPFEKKVLHALDYSDQQILYRVTPFFKDKELLARGVEMEAYSVEDHGF